MTIQADTLTELFNQGNENFKQGKYDEAIKFYQMILSKNIKNGFVYYNLGNAYFKQNNLGKAILNYERAKIYLPRDNDVRFNLRFANSQTRDRFSESDENPFTKIILFIYHIFDINTLFVIIYLIFLLLLSSLIIKWFNKKLIFLMWNRKIFTHGLILFFLLFFILMIKIVESKTTTLAIILADEINIKSGPSETYTDIFNLHSGTKVRIRKQNNDWFLISIPNGYNGWIHKNELEKI